MNEAAFTETVRNLHSTIGSLLQEIESLQRRIIAHHDMHNLSREAIQEPDVNGLCPICARAK